MLAIHKYILNIAFGFSVVPIKLNVTRRKKPVVNNIQHQLSITLTVHLLFPFKNWTS